MPQVEITIGGRSFEVACQDGEDHYLHAAAGMLDEEAQRLSSQIGRLPEQRMLLMAGLMLADKTAGLQEQVNEAIEVVAALQAENEKLRARPVERVEVPVIPKDTQDAMAELAARAEALADKVEQRQSAG